MNRGKGEGNATLEDTGNAMSTVLTGDQRHAVSVCDDQDSESLINVVPSILKNAILSVSQEDLDLDISELKEKYDVSTTTLRLRMSFWMEYENIVSSDALMSLSRICAGIVTMTKFRSGILNSPSTMAVILCPPTDYMIAAKECLDIGMDNIRKILAAPVLKKDGTLDAKAAEVIMKAYMLIDMRVKGAIVQKVDQRTLNVNKNETTHIVEVVETQQTIEEISARLLELRDKEVVAVKPLAPLKLSAGEKCNFTDTHAVAKILKGEVDKEEAIIKEWDDGIKAVAREKNKEAEDAVLIDDLL